MTWRTHALFGVCSLWLLTPIPGAVSSAPDWSNAGALSCLAALGALLPNLDAAQSKVKSLTVLGVRPLAPLSLLAHQTWGHRGFLHSIGGLALAGTFAALPSGWWGWQPSLALWLGYLSHLAADACTVSGIPTIPGRPERLHLLPARLRFVTGSPAEDALLPPLALLAASLLLRYLSASPA